jgi:hypothetical protein
MRAFYPEQGSARDSRTPCRVLGKWSPPSWFPPREAFHSSRAVSSMGYGGVLILVPTTFLRILPVGACHFVSAPRPCWCDTPMLGGGFAFFSSYLQCSSQGTDRAGKPVNVLDLRGPHATIPRLEQHRVFPCKAVTVAFPARRLINTNQICMNHAWALRTDPGLAFSPYQPEIVGWISWTPKISHSVGTLPKGLQV